MSIGLEQFRTASLGNVARLETSTSREGLNLKGTSGFGRAVEWIREKTGLRTERNASTMTSFVTALKAEYGDKISKVIENGLSSELKAGKRPLTSRVCAEVINRADSLRANLQDLKRDGGAGGSTFEQAAQNVKQRFGDSDALRVLSETHGEDADRLQRDIATGLSNALHAKGAVLRDDEALATVSEVMTQAVNRRANAILLKDLLDAKSQSAVREHVSKIASELGISSLIDGLNRADSELTASLIQFSLRNEKILLSEEGLKKVVAIHLPSIIVSKIGAEHLSELKSLSSDVNLAGKIVKQAMSQIDEKDTASVSRFIGLCVDKIADLDLSRDADFRCANELRTACEMYYKVVDNDEQKVAMATVMRDVQIGSAHLGGLQIKALAKAACPQSAIVDLAIKAAKNKLALVERNGEQAQGVVAPSAPSLEKLVETDTDVRNAKMGMIAVQNQFINALGGSIENSTINFVALRDKVSAMRRDVETLVNQASGTEVQALISARIREITSDMITAAMKTLGEPPIPFVAVSVGSAARGEASPYSDIEFAFLLKQNKTEEAVNYLKKLSQLVEFQVYQLGETDTPERPEGIHWDKGSFTPSDSPHKFIGTAKDLVQANLLMVKDSGQPEDFMTLAMFMGPDYLCGSLADEDGFALVKELQREISDHFGRPSGLGEATVGKMLGRALAADGAAIAKVSENVNADEVNVKNISRLPMLMLEGLALEHGLIFDNLGGAANSSVMRIDALIEKGALSPSDAEALKEAIGKLATARLNATLQAGCDDNTVHLTRKEGETGYVDASLRDVIRSLIPFAERIEQQKAGRSIEH